MPSILTRSGASVTQTNTADTKKKFRTVLGLSPFHLASAAPQSLHTTRDTAHKSTRSIDVTGASTLTASTYRKKHKTRTDRASVAEVSFYEPDSDLDHSQHERAEMVNMDSATKSVELLHERANRRKIVRLEAQDGPWSVSAAETPQDKRSYSIYIKTPTHHLTLTRTASEIIELHRKISASHPELTLPDLPLQFQDENMDQNGLGEKKRKSSFLHTLSRLASPGPNRRERPKDKDRERDMKLASAAPSSRTSLASAAASSTALASPTSSPSNELNDPFVAPFMDSMPSNGTTNATITALAAYLTTISNEAGLKHSKAWRRFVRVRTDDLESERVERAVKRVRSDLAVHLHGKGASIGAIMASPKMETRTPSATTVEMSMEDVHTSDEHVAAPPESLPQSEAIPVAQEEMPPVEPVPIAADVPTPESQEEVKDGGPASSPTVEAQVEPVAVPEFAVPSTPTHNSTNVGDMEVDAIPTEEAEPPSPVASPTSPTSSHATIAGRIPRSQSADPDKATRMSRMYMSSPLKTDGEESAMESESEVPGDADVETEAEGVSTTLEDDSSAASVGKRKKRPASRRKSSRSAKRVERKTTVDDFEMMRVLGKGCAGKVLLVRHKKQESLYALKAITKRHVLAHQELQHTLTEQSVLKRMAREAKDPFVVRLHWSFHDKENLFLVMDFHPGGDLATQLARWGRLGRDRARFYAAEIVEGVDGLHAAGVIYRDLKPENILIGADGHIVLTDFGLSKEFSRRSSPITAPPTPSGSRDFYASLPGNAQPTMPYWMKSDGNADAWPGQGLGQVDTTSTFCGTAEYLAPEVIQGLPYSYEVDWWSFGTMLYEMLTGITPFWANNHSEMYVRVLQDELKFPDDRAIDQDTKSLIRGLLQRNPALRIKQPRIKRHPYFSMIDWSHVYFKRYIPPYIPPIDPSNASDTQNFDDAFLDMEPVIQDETEQTESDTGDRTDTDRTDGEDSVRTPAQSRSPSVHPDANGDEDAPDLFDGYSFKGRNSVIIDDDVDADEEGDASDIADEDDEDKLIEAAKAAIAALDADLQQEEQTVTEEHTPVPKTPEQRNVSLSGPPVDAEAAAAEPSLVVDVPPTPQESGPAPVTKIAPPVSTSAEGTPKVDVEKAMPAIHQTPESPTDKVATLPAPPVAQAGPPPKAISPAVAARLVGPARGPRSRREKSGVPALDKYLSDTIDEDGEATERDDDDDWDFVEAPGGEERNGAKGTSLFARGVVDRYKLAVFRKASTPSKTPTPGKNTATRNFSGMSHDSEVNGTESASPSPSEKHQRGRNPALTFRRNPKQFLRARSPMRSAFSGSSSTTSRPVLQHSASAIMSASTASITGLLTPSPSTGPSLATAGPSLKSKESNTSVGSPASSSDQSVDGDGTVASPSTPEAAGGTKVNGHQNSRIGPRPSQTSLVDEPEKVKGKKLKKYKEGAEKMLSLFASPRP